MNVSSRFQCPEQRRRVKNFERLSPPPAPSLDIRFFYPATGNSLKEDKERAATTKRSTCLGAIKVVSHLFNFPPRRNPESRKTETHPVCTVLHPNARRQGCQDFRRAESGARDCRAGHSTLDPGPCVPKPGAKSCMQLSGLSLSFPRKVATASTAQGQGDWVWSASLHPHILHLEPHLYGRGHLYGRRAQP